MKTNVLLMLTVMVMALNANSQEQTSRMSVPKGDVIKPYIGVGSFNISGIASDFSAKSGVVAGAVYEWNAPVANLSVETGLEYMQAGAQREYVWADSGAQAIKQDLDMNYLTIPVKARYQFLSQENEALKYKAIGGLTVAQLLSAKSKTNIFGQKEEKDITSDFHSTDLLASLGVGAEYEVLGCTGSIDLEYTHGLLEVSKDSGGHNEGLIVKAGFAMPL